MRHVVLAILLIIGGAVSGQSASQMQRQLDAHATKLQAWAEDKALAGAVKLQNAQQVAIAEIKVRDAAWVAGKDAALMRSVTTGACADLLRKLAAAGGYGEAFVSDDQGALVCAAQPTSDYWQGDEPKWTKSFAEGRGAVYIDRPRLDDSSQAQIAHISVPVRDGDRAIGVLTVGVPVELLRAHQ
jgi:type II secretory pathway pseudopilin PulG